MSENMTMCKINVWVVKFNITHRHDTKLVGYGLRLNEFVSYLNWQVWPVNKHVMFVFNPFDPYN